MKQFKLIMIMSMLFLSLFALAACGQEPAGNDGAEQGGEEQQAEEKTTLRIGTEPIAHITAESAVSVLEEMGYEVEIVMFDDFFTPNVALDEGSIDANFYQHQPFLDMYNNEKGTDLVMLAPGFMFFRGIYSEVYDSLDALKAGGGEISLAQDASNLSIDLIMLRDAGLITLTDEEKDLYDIADIKDNPYNFTFTTMDSNTRFSSTGDVAAYLSASNGVEEYGFDPQENLLYYEDCPEQALGVVVKAENANTDWAQDLITAYTSDEAKEYVLERTGGGYVPVEQ